MPPPGATCCLCGTVAAVRLVTRHGDDPTDYCDLLHWPPVAAGIRARGLDLVDTTGDLAAVKAEFGTWDIWRSSSGRLYASTVLGNGQGTTVDAFLIGPLREQMLKIETGRVSAHV
jgi:hypothetical protein